MADAGFQSHGVDVGYEISFESYFYKVQHLRTLEEMCANVLVLR